MGAACTAGTVVVSATIYVLRSTYLFTYWGGGGGQTLLSRHAREDLKLTTHHERNRREGSPTSNTFYHTICGCKTFRLFVSTTAYSYKN